MQKFINGRMNRLFMVTVLGFASGLPLALTGTTLQTWLTLEGIDLTTIGFFSLAGLPYTFKFLWAPLMDRFEPPFLGRRRGWLVVVQLALAFALYIISTLSPKGDTQLFALLAVFIAFLSASQDIVIDAYRTDVLDTSERGLGSSLSVFGYRVAMILSGGIAMVWADAAVGNGWSWPKIYGIMGTIMIALGVLSCIILPPVPKLEQPTPSSARNDVLGFFALLVTAVLGYLFTTKIVAPCFEHLFQSWVSPETNPESVALLKKWLDLLALFVGLIVTVPAGIFAAKKIRFETLNISLAQFFSMKGAYSILGLIVLYKLGDAFAGALTTPFLLKGAGFSQAEIGVVNKVIGIWLTIFGALLGGTMMMRMGLFKSLFLFGILQALSNFGFWFIAILGKGAWGGFSIPPFDLVLVALKEATNVDLLLVTAIGFENITGGMGTAAFVALLMALCHQRFTATQYALLSAFASIGRVWVGPMAGVLATSMGWPSFFILSTVVAIPGIALLWCLKATIVGLEVKKEHLGVDD